MDIYKIVGKLMLEGKEQFNKDVEDTKKKGNSLATSIGNSLAALGKAGAKAAGVAVKVGATALGAAATAVGAMTKASIESFAEYQQLAGGVQKIFEDMDTSKILQDAANAYKDLGMTANEYLAIVNDVGASFASTMGAEAGYEAAKKGLTAISDYASGTGKNFDELQQKLALITRSTSSYQSIADQFSGVLPATSEGFLQQAQAAGILSAEYKKLTDVPIEEYQKAVTDMLALGVDALGLTGNTAAEATETISGSLTMLKASWQNLLAGLADEQADLDTLIANLANSAVAAAKNIAPKVTQILNGISTMVTQMAPMLVDAIPVIINDVLPGMLDAGVLLLQSLIDGIAQNIDAISTSAIQIIMLLVDVLLGNLPTIVTVGMQLLTAVITGIAQQAPELVPVILQCILLIGQAIISATPQLLDAGVQLIGGLFDGLWNGLVALCPQLGGWVTTNIYEPIKEACGFLYTLGEIAVGFLWDGLCDFANMIFPGLGDMLSGHTEDAVKEAGKNMEGLSKEYASAASSASDAAAKTLLDSSKKIPVNAETPVSAMAKNMQNDTSMETAATEAVERTSSALETAVSASGFYSSGVTAMKKFNDGLKSMESTLKDTVKKIVDQLINQVTAAVQEIDRIINSIGSGGDKPTADSRNGLFFNPGEDVLNATEASAWRAGKAVSEGTVDGSNHKTSNSSGITIIQNIQSVPQTPVEFAAATEAYFEQARWALA